MIARTDSTASRGPLAFAYGRISHKSQEDRDSVPAQEKRSRWYFDGILVPQGIGWGGFFHDGHRMSAYRRPFPKRPSGRKIISLLEPGDHVIFDKVDRVWRSVADFEVLLAWFRRHQIHVHFVDYAGASFQVDKPMGKFIITLMVNAAELSSAETSERIKRDRSFKRSEGRWDGRQVPYGCKLVGKKHQRRLVWDNAQLDLARRICQLIDDEGYTKDAVAELLEREACAATGRPFRNHVHPERFWTGNKISKIYTKAVALLQVAPSMDPNAINFEELYGRKPRTYSMLTKELLD